MAWRPYQDCGCRPMPGPIWRQQAILTPRNTDALLAQTRTRGHVEAPERGASEREAKQQRWEMCGHTAIAVGMGGGESVGRRVGSREEECCSCGAAARAASGVEGKQGRDTRLRPGRRAGREDRSVIDLMKFSLIFDK